MILIMAAILKKNSLWLLLLYMAVAAYCYYEKVRRTICTATVSCLPKKANKIPNPVTCRTSTLIDRILLSFPSRGFQKAVINAGISDLQIIFCTQKI